MTVNIVIKRAEFDLVKRAKIAAIGQDVTLREFVLQAIERALPADRDERARAGPPARRRRKGNGQ